MANNVTAARVTAGERRVRVASSSSSLLERDNREREEAMSTPPLVEGVSVVSEVLSKEAAPVEMARNSSMVMRRPLPMRMV